MFKSLKRLIASNGGLKGFLEMDNYHDFANCYVDIQAAPECEAINVSYTSVAVEECDSCGCDRFYLETDFRQFPKQCGCIGAGCDDVVWGRNDTNPETGDEDYYYYYHDLMEDGSLNYTYIYEEYGTMGESQASPPKHEGQIIQGNKFRFN